MELIPILSTIILVATICTFILAIGAYILYKIREGKVQHAYATKPTTVKAELVTPATVAESSTTRQGAESQLREGRRVEPGISQEFNTQGRRPSQSRYTPEPRPFKVREEKPTTEKTKVQQKFTDENKFLKYTSDGYVSPKEDRDSGAIKWR